MHTVSREALPLMKIRGLEHDKNKLSKDEVQGQAENRKAHC